MAPTSFVTQTDNVEVSNGNTDFLKVIFKVSDETVPCEVNC